MQPRSSPRRRAGFTLVELGVVILIIGIMMSFLLVASFDGLKRANERATQSLIQKLDLAVTDRIEALVSQRQEPNNAHRFLAMSVVPDPSGNLRFIESEARARLIAQIDYIKREMPDVFYIQGGADTPYPLNFAGRPFSTQALEPGVPSPSLGQLTEDYAPHILPLGHATRLNLVWNAGQKTFLPGGPTNFIPLGEMSGLGPKPMTEFRFTSPPAGQGIFGASYSAMGSLMRLLGEHPVLGAYPSRGFNGIDDNRNGLIDEFAPDELYAPGDPDIGNFGVLQQHIQQRLNNHQHITARSEMLYAILVGGVGPLGSVFSPDDFTPQEVRDTDNDGLPEFVDAWGRPLQFYRWPIYFVSELGGRSLQKGEVQYDSLTEPREENPLDPNQLLVAPGWWSNLSRPPADPTDADSARISTRANLFSRNFFSLVDPYADDDSFIGGGHWDRTSYYRRRAYFFKHLILSAGPDRQYGVASFGVSYSPSSQTTSNQPLIDTPPALPISDRLILIENQAARSDPFRPAGDAGLFQEPVSGSLLNDLLRDRWGVDDITNHSLNTLGTGGR